VDFTERKIKKITLSVEEAFHKIKLWCAYQERSQYETRQKLYDYGLFTEQVENIISLLIEENFLNEQRFANALTSGKLNIKHWGRTKIKIELKKHRVSEVCVKFALATIDEKKYCQILDTVLNKKMKLIKDKNTFTFNQKLFQFAFSKGFESDIISQQIKELKNKA
jgi:regulatory protein